MAQDVGVWCFVVCFGFYHPQPPVVTDSYCQTYRRVVSTKQELGEIMKLPRSIRDKMQGNDLDYLCRCLKWKNPVCRGRSSTGR